MRGSASRGWTSSPCSTTAWKRMWKRHLTRRWWRIGKWKKLWNISTKTTDSAERGQLILLILQKGATDSADFAERTTDFLLPKVLPWADCFWPFRPFSSAQYVFFACFDIFGYRFGPSLRLVAPFMSYSYKVRLTISFAIAKFLVSYRGICFSTSLFPIYAEMYSKIIYSLKDQEDSETD